MKVSALQEHNDQLFLLIIKASL